MKSTIRKFIPPQALIAYHRTLGHLGAIRYGHPSRDMFVIGVTGTNGKTTVANLITDIFQADGQPSGCATTTNFRYGTADKQIDRLNASKQTMLGRTQLQQLLAEMRDAGIKNVAVETSSEGIAQFRHEPINYNAAILTNLTPEHIESHGSYENYRAAKRRLFEHVLKTKGDNAALAINLDITPDDLDFFLDIPGIEQARLTGFTLKGNTHPKISPEHTLRITAITEATYSFTLHYDNSLIDIVLNLPGRVNIENAAAAASIILRTTNISLDTIKSGLESRTSIPGRFEFVHDPSTDDIQVLVDYAPEPASQGALFEFLKTYRNTHNINRIIHITGSAGGGRDTSRRPILGALSADNTDITIVTNEDPYDEDPSQIIDQVAAGALNTGKRTLDKNIFKILDRRDAINKAITELAQPGDLVLLTGKGSEQAIVGPNNTKTKWDEREVAREMLQIRAK